MKILALISLIISISLNINAQTTNVKCTISFIIKNFNSKDTNLSIKIVNSHAGFLNNNPEEIINFKPQKDKILKIIKLKEPCTANAYLMLKDSIISLTSIFVIANENLTIKFDTILAKVYSKESVFLENNLFLYLKMPNDLMRTEGYTNEIARRYYELKIPDNIRLFKKYQEYERNVLASVKLNRNYYFNIQALYREKEQISLKSLEQCLSYIPPHLSNTTIGKMIKEHINDSKKLGVGKFIPEFVILDSLDNLINSNIVLNKNKFLLIDFWASWCVPCREKMKYLTKLYPDLDTSKIDFVSISIDENKSKWMAASLSDKVIWSSYYDSPDQQRKAQKIFTINYIPFNFIADKDGRLVEINIWDEKLYEYLKKNKLLKNISN